MSASAHIDRRVRIASGPSELLGVIERVSNLRALPFVVLLGEPGIGKTTVMRQEAHHCGTAVVRVRAFINGQQVPQKAVLFLDALDEYRSDGNRSDQADRLGGAIVVSGVQGWRLACRSEDWRKEADIEAIQRTTNGSEIVVAQLLPLNRDESAAVLGALGEPCPHEFVNRAESLGAASFLENPLSLRLLRKAVSAGSGWPTKRFDIFRLAIRQLAFEHDQVLQLDWRRHDVDEIVAAAARVCLFLLVSGRQTIWRSNGEPPSVGGDERAYLSANELRLSPSLVRDMLDTPLFRGETDSFEPMHRAVAEYLAGQALAEVVAGSCGHAWPLSRAVALITGPDKRPPTELRGLYAWFAAHLSNLGDNAGASRLIRADAFTVLAYGDGAAFSTSGKLAILECLPLNGPFFWTHEVASTALGSLACDELGPAFADVLRSDSDETHRRALIFEALTSGRPVAQVRPLLREIALDPKRQQRERKRAADAWLNGVADLAAARRELFDDLAAEAVSPGREGIRLHLAESLPAAALTISDIKSIIADYEGSGQGNVVGQLYGLTLNLVTDPRPELFDEPIQGWLPVPTPHSLTSEVDRLLDNVLAASVQKTSELTADRLWRWLCNTAERVWWDLPENTKNAIQEWLDGDEDREVALFVACVSLSDDPNFNIFSRGLGWKDTETIVKNMLISADTAVNVEARDKALRIAVDIADRGGINADLYWQLYNRVTDQTSLQGLSEQLIIRTIPAWHYDQYVRKQERRARAERQRAADVAYFAPRLAECRAGEDTHGLGWAAAKFFLEGGSDQADRSSSIQRLEKLTNEAIVEAILLGWRQLAEKGSADITPGLLGAAQAKGSCSGLELAIVAGAECLLYEVGDWGLINAPMATAIAVLRSSGLAGSPARREALERWALYHLGRGQDRGASALLEFWSAALDSGATTLDNLGRFVDKDNLCSAAAPAIHALLAARPSMEIIPLRTAVSVGARLLSPGQLLELARSAQRQPQMRGPQLAVWLFVAFALDPNAYWGQLVSALESEPGPDSFEEALTGDLVEALEPIDGSAWTRRSSVIIRHFGRVSPPVDNMVVGVVTEAHVLSGAVQTTLNRLSSDPEFSASLALSDLVSDATLSEWHLHLQHAQAQQARLYRDRAFRHPPPAKVRAALEGGAPVGAGDLRAIAMEELGRLRDELRKTDTTPWKSYWNLKLQRPVEPLIENECRNRLLDRIRDRLRPYGITIAIPEAQRAENTRVDLLILSSEGGNLPIEIKRHDHPMIWQAAAHQLQRYAADIGAEGMSIYLVFWFGNGLPPVPPRADGGRSPESAVELERMLIADLSPELQALTDVIVFDVSRPGEVRTRRARGRRSKLPG